MKTQTFLHTKKKKTVNKSNGDKLPEIDFYANILGNLKFCLKNAINNKFFYYFRYKGELFEKFGEDLDNLDVESEVWSTGCD